MLHSFRLLCLCDLLRSLIVSLRVTLFIVLILLALCTHLLGLQLFRQAFLVIPCILTHVLHRRRRTMWLWVFTRRYTWQLVGYRRCIRCPLLVWRLRARPRWGLCGN